MSKEEGVRLVIKQIIKSENEVQSITNIFSNGSVTTTKYPSKEKKGAWSGKGGGDKKPITVCSGPSCGVPEQVCPEGAFMDCANEPYGCKTFADFGDPGGDPPIMLEL